MPAPFRISFFPLTACFRHTLILQDCKEAFVCSHQTLPRFKGAALVALGFVTCLLEF